MGNWLDDKDNPTYKEVNFQKNTDMNVYESGIQTFTSADLEVDEHESGEGRKSHAIVQSMKCYKHMKQLRLDRSVICRTGPSDRWTGPRSLTFLGPVQDL